MPTAEFARSNAIPTHNTLGTLHSHDLSINDLSQVSEFRVVIAIKPHSLRLNKANYGPKQKRLKMKVF